ncbi:OLC1v1001071C1 [Oldenlandia corymbosa var. corymbosa]|uniref:OLC1v1001071C1 n=1 Tax=Oldenlandia corymbosa var. corymbosa TaxID=529605 RepID=A0AAV1D7G1_OLDCO|nr:OLC1v1001071C1 [Oldenlandia corymbosa var. corymbosa]
MSFTETVKFKLYLEYYLYNRTDGTITVQWDAPDGYLIIDRMLDFSELVDKDIGAGTSGGRTIEDNEDGDEDGDEDEDKDEDKDEDADEDEDEDVRGVESSDDEYVPSDEDSDDDTDFESSSSVPYVFDDISGWDKTLEEVENDGIKMWDGNPLTLGLDIHFANKPEAQAAVGEWNLVHGRTFRLKTSSKRTWWSREKKVQGITRFNLAAYRDQLAVLAESDFVWMPYTTLLGRIARVCLVGQGIWRSQTWLICGDVVAPHNPSRVFRQFGYHQRIPGDALLLTAAEITSLLKRKPFGGSDRRWLQQLGIYLQVWNDRHGQVVGTDDDYVGEPSADPEYLLWYHQVTVKYVTDPTDSENARGFHGSAETLRLMATLMEDVRSLSIIGQHTFDADSFGYDRLGEIAQVAERALSVNATNVVRHDLDRHIEVHDILSQELAPVDPTQQHPPPRPPRRSRRSQRGRGGQETITSSQPHQSSQHEQSHIPFTGGSSHRSPHRSTPFSTTFSPSVSTSFIPSVSTSFFADPTGVLPSDYVSQHQEVNFSFTRFSPRLLGVGLEILLLTFLGFSRSEDEDEAEDADQDDQFEGQGYQRHEEQGSSQTLGTPPLAVSCNSLRHLNSSGTEPGIASQDWMERHSKEEIIMMDTNYRGDVLDVGPVEVPPGKGICGVLIEDSMAERMKQLRKEAQKLKDEISPLEGSGNRHAVTHNLYAEHRIEKEKNLKKQKNVHPTFAPPGESANVDDDDEIEGEEEQEEDSFESGGGGGEGTMWMRRMSQTSIPHLRGGIYILETSQSHPRFGGASIGVSSRPEAAAMSSCTSRRSKVSNEEIDDWVLTDDVPGGPCDGHGYMNIFHASSPRRGGDVEVLMVGPEPETGHQLAIRAQSLFRVDSSRFMCNLMR